MSTFVHCITYPRLAARRASQNSKSPERVWPLQRCRKRSAFALTGQPSRSGANGSSSAMSASSSIT
eukprot:2320821-Pyramimonas_sp.AAC.1